MKLPRWRTASGQALVEMVLILPVLLLFTLAIISYGLYINAVATVQEAARVGARAAAIGDTLGCPGDSANAELAAGDPPTVYGMVDDEINNDRPWLQANGQSLITFAALVGNQTNPQNNNVMVTIVYPYHPLLPIPGLLPSALTIAQTYQMMVETPQPSNALSTTEPAGESAAWTSPAPPTTNVTYLVQPNGCA
ncbi:MAG: pilus assembly protein [Firmicutes bacterium]|nr:pilus assembly protein [Bacillota bacterium]